jgi:hypothetical protein
MESSVPVLGRISLFGSVRLQFALRKAQGPGGSRPSNPSGSPAVPEPSARLDGYGDLRPR